MLESLIEEVKAVHKEVLEIKNQLEDVSDVINFYKENIVKDEEENGEKISIDRK